MKEMVLYYTPENTPNVAKLKSVLVRMGVRIRNVLPEQAGQTIGFLVGLPGFEENVPGTEESLASACPGDKIPAEVLVMYQFSSRRIDELLLNLRRAGVPRIALKAVVTEYNSHWTFRQLYEELKKEHEAMTPSRG